MPRKKANIHYLYKTTCIVTGRYYIGMHSTSNLEDGYLGSGKRLTRSVRKYGKENHVKEILEFFDCREALIEAEKKAIVVSMVSDENCMNIMSGGTGGIISEVHHQKMIQGSIKWVKDKWKDITYREKITKLSLDRLIKSHQTGKIKYDTFTGKKHSEETKQKMRKPKNVGDTNSQYGTIWITNGVENKKVMKDDEIPAGWCKGRKLNAP